MLVKEKISRIPWREFVSKQLIKIFGLGFIAFLLILTMIFSASLDLEIIYTSEFSNTDYLLVILLSSVAFLVVLIGFTKIILFDMADDFGLRDATGAMVYNLRFWLFTILIVSFCSSIYILLDVQLESTYLVLLLVLLTRSGLEAFDLSVSDLTELTGLKYYHTVRNFYFDVFYLLLLAFSILFFLAILTTFARRKIIKQFKKDDTSDEEIAKQGIKAVYKLLFWILTPPVIFFTLKAQLTSERANEAMLFFILLLFLVISFWWIYFTLRVIFLTVWKGVKITAFITIVNVLVIIPLIVVLWLLPAFLLSSLEVLEQNLSSLTILDILVKFINVLISKTVDFKTVFQIDFIIITSLATLVVGFAEGFAIVAIITALFKGVEVARTGRILVRSPPKAVVIFENLVLLGIWLSLLWDSFVQIITTLVDNFNFNFGLKLPDFFTIVYEMILTPISLWLARIDLALKNIPFLIIPVLIIFSGAFKFLSVTFITPRVQKRSDFFFLLISTGFVLITTNILGYIYELGIEDAPLYSIPDASELLSNAVYIFADAEALAFYGGFLFGIGYVFWRLIHREDTSFTTTGLERVVEESLSDDPSVQDEAVVTRDTVKREISDWEETEEEE